MRVYIAGPMTGIPYYNWPAFIDAQKAWSDEGWEVVTPIEANHIVWRRHYGRDYDPSTDYFTYGNKISNEIYGEDQKLLSLSDAIALLPGWRASKGANHELYTARLLNLAVFDAMTFAELSPEGEPIMKQALGAS